MNTMQTECMPEAGMTVLRERHREAVEQVTAQLAALRGGCGCLDAYGAACKEEVSLRLMIEKLETPSGVKTVDPGEWKRREFGQDPIADVLQEFSLSSIVAYPHPSDRSRLLGWTVDRLPGEE